MINSPTLENLKPLVSQLPKKIPYLKMLVLFGSQATGKTHPNSDWDFAVLYDETLRQEYLKGDPLIGLEVPLILGEVFNLNSDQIDVVDMNRCHSLIANSAAINGQLIYEKESGEFENFKKQFTLTPDQQKEIHLNLRREIDIFLKNWGLI